MKSVIIHKYTFNCGGLGDFIRAIITLYCACKDYDIDYYIDLSENKSKCCFDTQPIPEFDKSIPVENIRLKFETKNFVEFIENIKANPKIYYIVTNYYGYKDCNYITPYIDEITNYVIKPSKLVCDYIYNFYKEHNLNKQGYISLHLRTGDCYIYNEHKESAPSKFTTDDNRLREGRVDMYDTFIKKICKQFDLPIILHCDSIEVKNKLLDMNKDINNLVRTNFLIQHTANLIGENTDESYISTVAEFYIISCAKIVIMPYVYSGFSHIAAIIGKTEFHTKMSFNHITFLSLGPEKISNL
jgi:hypothetical protein